MNSSSRYIPLSLVLFIAATTGSAQAGSTLDPYAHIRPPQSASEKQQKQLLPLGKKKVENQPVVRSADEVEQPTTYVTMPMGNLSDGDNKKGPGLFGKSIPGVGGIAAPFKAASAGIVKGSQKIGGGI